VFAKFLKESTLTELEKKYPAMVRPVGGHVRSKKLCPEQHI
jgi:hypothetical protein